MMKLQNMKRSEDTEQMLLMDWAAGAESRYPELRWLHHIPNGGSRNGAEAAKLRRMGVKRAYPTYACRSRTGGTTDCT